MASTMERLEAEIALAKQIADQGVGEVEGMALWSVIHLAEAEMQRRRSVSGRPIQPAAAPPAVDGVTDAAAELIASGGDVLSWIENDENPPGGVVRRFDKALEAFRKQLSQGTATRSGRQSKDNQQEK